MTPEEAQQWGPPVVWRGYACDVVDRFRDAVLAAFSDYEAEIGRLRTELEQARERQPDQIMERIGAESATIVRAAGAAAQRIVAHAHQDVATSRQTLRVASDELGAVHRTIGSLHRVVQALVTGTTTQATDTHPSTDSADSACVGSETSDHQHLPVEPNGSPADTWPGVGSQPETSSWVTVES